MWEKIVLNLISNAFKYTLEGSVAAKVSEREGVAELSVSDTGVGIPDQELPRIFERFHRVEAVRGRTHEGTGIGLALVQELAKLHRGSVAVSSAWGKGSVFTVRIPFGTAHLPADRIGANHALASTALHPETYVEEALRWLGTRSDAAEAGEEGEPGSYSPELSGTECWWPTITRMREYIRRLLETRYEVSTVANGKEARRLLWRIHRS
jgi:hypothetical protein